MRHLTRVLVGKSEAARRRLSDNYAWHRALWRALPGADDRPRDFLFRLDDLRTDFRVYLLSPHRPTVQDWGHWATKTVSETFLAHTTYRFQLKANPTLRRNSDRRRLGIYAEPRLREWMTRKAEDHGFNLDAGALSVSAPIDETFVRDGRRGKHVSVDFQGRLKVRDREAFRAAFLSGIGTAKAFGFGLLMLSPEAQ